MSGLEERALAEVIREQATPGADFLTKAQFAEFVGTYLDERDSSEELVEIWQAFGGAAAGDGFVRSLGTIRTYFKHFYSFAFRCIPTPCPSNQHTSP